jgi:hypothetical protein
MRLENFPKLWVRIHTPCVNRRHNFHLISSTSHNFCKGIEEIREVTGKESTTEPQ